MAFLSPRGKALSLARAALASSVMQKNLGLRKALSADHDLQTILTRIQARRPTVDLVPIISAVRAAKELCCLNYSIHFVPQSARGLSSSTSLLVESKKTGEETSKKVAVRQDEDPFDSITDKIPERPVSVAEGASYSVVILAGLAVAGFALYAVVKELILQPKEYTIFNMALSRVQSDGRITGRIGTPVKGYGQESRNRAARQRISHRSFTDESGTERTEVQFHIRGPRGNGLVHCEMFKEKGSRRYEYTYLIVDILAPTASRVMLESYIPAAEI